MYKSNNKVEILLGGMENSAFATPVLCACQAQSKAN